MGQPSEITQDTLYVLAAVILIAAVGAIAYWSGDVVNYISQRPIAQRQSTRLITVWLLVRILLGLLWRIIKMAEILLLGFLMIFILIGVKVFWAIVSPPSGPDDKSGGTGFTRRSSRRRNPNYIEKH